MKKWKKPFVADLWWFPADDLDMEIVEDKFTVRLPFEPTRYDEEPEDIPVFVQTTKKGRLWVGMPRGATSEVHKCVVDKRVFKTAVDMQCDAPAEDMDLKMVGTWRGYQKTAVAVLTKFRNGVLQAPPRMGKTVIGVGVAAELKRKTLVLAHQTDLVEQFLNQTILNKDLFEARKGLAGICKEPKDFEKYDICLATYQTFISEKGAKTLDAIKDLFGVVIVDEAHRGSAARYSSVLSKFSARRMYGLTATPDRKDMTYPVTEKLVGPVIHEIGRDMVLSPKVYGHRTPSIPPPVVPDNWNRMMDKLFKDQKRNEMVVKAVVHDVGNGHDVLIPLTRVSHAQELGDMITKVLGDVCFLFTGSIPKKKRQWARDKMRSKEVRVTLATRSMLLGMDVPNWSAIYTVAPISNVPTYTQEVFRVCTALEGKRRPIVRYFMDSRWNFAHGCLRTCAKTLLDPENAFEPKKSFLDLLTVPGKRKPVTGTEWENSNVFRPDWGTTEKPIKRF